jgi:hypothetical protein
MWAGSILTLSHKPPLQGPLGDVESLSRGVTVSGFVLMFTRGTIAVIALIAGVAQGAEPMSERGPPLYANQTITS